MLLFPFLCFPGIYNTTDLPKIFFLSFVLFFIAMMCALKIYRKELYLRKQEIFFFVSSIFFLSVSGIVSIFADNWMDAIFGSVDRYMGWYSYFLVIVLAYFLIISRVKASSIVSTIITSGTLLAIIGILQKIGIFDGSFLWQLIVDGRVTATIGQYNNYASLLVVPFWFAILRLKYEKPHIVGYILLLITLIGGVLASGSRIALIGVMVCSLILVTNIKKSRILALVGVGIIVISGIIFSWRLSLTEENVASFSSRILLISDAIQEIQHFSLPEILLWKGNESQQLVLLKQFSPKYLAYEQINFIPDRVHNIFLDFLIQFGAFGTLLLVGVLFIFPLYLFLRKQGEIRWYAFVALIFFLINSIGFYDISNLLFSFLLISILLQKISVPEKKYILPRGSLIFIVGITGIIIYGLFFYVTDFQEQQLFISRTSETNDSNILGIFNSEGNISTMKAWQRDILLAKTLAMQLWEEVKNKDSVSEFQTLCKKNSYYTLQVCTRYLMLQSEHTQYLDDKINLLLQLAPYDPIMLQMKIDRLLEKKELKKAQWTAKFALSLFPAFIYQPDNSITEYQQRKKKKILEYYPIKKWQELSYL